MQLEEQFEDVASTTCVVILCISLDITLGMIVKRLIDKNMHELSSCKSLVNQDHLATEVGRCENTCRTKEGLSASACCDCFFATTNTNTTGNSSLKPQCSSPDEVSLAEI